MKYEIYYCKTDNSYCLLGENKTEKERNYLTIDSEKINEFIANNVHEAHSKYDTIMIEHQSLLNCSDIKTDSMNNSIKCKK